MVSRSQNHCYICGEDTPSRLQEHHLVPKRHGGTDRKQNMVTLCAGCHQAVEQLYDDAFYERLFARADPEEFDGNHDAGIEIPGEADPNISFRDENMSALIEALERHPSRKRDLVEKSEERLGRPEYRQVEPESATKSDVLRLLFRVAIKEVLPEFWDDEAGCIQLSPELRSALEKSDEQTEAADT
jgi:hypothetical protein